MNPEPKPFLGAIVHYVSHGTPLRPDGSQAYVSQCRAAIITEVTPASPAASLCVFNPEGQFFKQGVLYAAGGETPGLPDCAVRHHHGSPFRYCACGWIEAAYPGGTWHYIAGCVAGESL